MTHFAVVQVVTTKRMALSLLVAWGSNKKKEMYSTCILFYVFYHLRLVLCVCVYAHLILNFFETNNLKTWIVLNNVNIFCKSAIVFISHRDMILT